MPPNSLSSKAGIALQLKGIHGRRLERALLVLHLAAMRPPILSVGGGLADVGLPALCESMMKSPAMTEREMALQYAMACAEGTRVCSRRGHLPKQQ